MQDILATTKQNKVLKDNLEFVMSMLKKHDIKIVGNYIDRAISGATDNLPDFKKMLKDNNNKKWDYVLVYKFDRFSRNKYVSVIHKKSLRDKGISVISAM